MPHHTRDRKRRLEKMMGRLALFTAALLAAATAALSFPPSTASVERDGPVEVSSNVEGAQQR
jgi:hypothetical protein